MSKIKFDQRGFTLLEVLASVVIISILLLVFFGFFSQSMLFSSKNEKQLEALNIAREVHANVQQGIPSDNQYIRGNKTYYVSVVNITPPPSEMRDIKDSSLPPFSLYTFEISVYSSPTKSSDSLLARTFGYFKKESM